MSNNSHIVTVDASSGEDTAVVVMQSKPALHESAKEDLVEKHEKEGKAIANLLHSKLPKETLIAMLDALS